MIGRIKHPQQPGKVAFVPLRYDREQGEWVSLLPDDQSCDQAIDASRACLGRILPKWSDIVRACRVLRALCDHPQFEFEGDHLDADMVRQEARTLASFVESLRVDLEHLLQEPQADDRVRIAGVVSGDELADITGQEDTE
jgi:hypothetical protein